RSRLLDKGLRMNLWGNLVNISVFFHINRLIYNKSFMQMVRRLSSGLLRRPMKIYQLPAPSGQPGGSGKIAVCHQTPPVGGR
ncbi:MAG: hypothetical protein Q8927_21535, partial [Bacteroidota bacterium]|nr:hypothetical protein [Bacteroidota bacterium]